MTVSSTRSRGAKSRRVAFSGADVIEYDAELPPVVRFAGAKCFSAPLEAAEVTLECHARGLGAADCSALEQRQSLSLQYVAELQRLLRFKGFEPIGDELQELQTQHQVVELLLAWVAADSDADKENQSTYIDLLDPQTLRRAQLAKKQLQGRVDDGYAFGRRFLSVAAFVETLSSEELQQLAEERGVKKPTLDDKQRASVKALDRELLGLYGTAEGRPLRSLTLRQLVTEAEERGMLGPDKAKDSKGKKSKRAWVDVLRPVMVAEVRAAKIREQEEELLRQKVVQQLEREKQNEQRERVIQLIQKLMQQQCKENGDGDCAEPEDDAALGDEDNQDCNKKTPQLNATRTYLEALVKTICIPSEAQEDVVMKE